MPKKRFYLDLSKITKPEELKSVGKSNWFMVVDEMSKLKFRTFHQTKNGMVEPTCAFLKKIKQQRCPVHHMRCDNARENKVLEKLCNSVRCKLDV